MRHSLFGRGWRLLAVLTGLIIIAALASVPAEPADQATLAGLVAIAALLVGRSRSRAAALVLAALSVAVTARYLFWRAADTIPSTSALEATLGWLLWLAEAAAGLSLALGFLRIAWPLGRSVRPLPPDSASWPSVDVFVTSAGEDADLARVTVLAALGIDWPAERLEVWLLDDAAQPDLAAFADGVGARYLARDQRTDFKAGNLNHGLAHATGDFVAVFDCDQAPTRAFLQLTMGWLLADPRLGFVQTAQRARTADPFQAACRRAMPAEEDLFHGVIQDGHDAWGAALFTGSGAVLRRAALDEVGGFAPQTLTEDAQTGLRLHRRGWRSAYLRLPLAAGLAPPSLADWVAQRRRWARGMIHLLRLDNPLVGRGLRPGQRLCYAMAMTHFLFPVTRLVFLLAPLAFLLGGQRLIVASAAAMAAYGLPHLFHAVLAAGRLQGRWRAAFWSELFETAAAASLWPAVVGTLLWPRRGTFNVTAKRLPAARPRRAWALIVLAALLAAGVARGIVALAPALVSTLANPGRGTVTAVSAGWAMNTGWAFLSLLIVLAALAVWRRPSPPAAGFAARVPLYLRDAEGRLVAGTTRMLGLGGAEIVLRDESDLPPGTDIAATLALDPAPVSLPARVMMAEGRLLRLSWELDTPGELADLVRVVHGRADAWVSWPDAPAPRPGASLLGLLRLLGRLLRPAAVSLLILLPGIRASAETHPSRGGNVTVRATAPRSVPLPSIVIPSRPAAGPAPGSSPAPAVAPASAPAPAVVPAPQPAAPLGSRTVVFSLRQLGAAGALALHGTSEEQAVTFGLRGDEVVSAAQLDLAGVMSPALLPDSNITVTVNDKYVGTVTPSREQPAFSVSQPVPAEALRESNRLAFRFSGRYAPDCNDPLSGQLWATIYDTSTLTLTVQRLPPQRDLARLPQPFIDPSDRERLSLPIVLPAGPGNEMLRAAGIVASWLGTQAGARGVDFPVTAQPPAEGNALLLAASTEAAAGAGLPPLTGPTVAVVPNAHDPFGSLLVVAGRSSAELVAAATGLAVASRTLGGESSPITAVSLPNREPYDAPAWIPTDRPVRLGEMAPAASLQVSGYTGLLHVPFRTAPDLWTWRGRPFPLDLRYRVPEAVADSPTTRVDVGVNGQYIDTVALSGRGDAPEHRLIDIPAWSLAGSNDLQIYFDVRPTRHGACDAVPGDLRMAVDPDSTLDLSRGVRFATLPDLGMFASSGFPFTRLADLSQTAIVLPDNPSPEDLSAFLGVMARLGSMVGTPSVKVAVLRPAGAEGVADRDLLVIGAISQLTGLDDLLARTPLRVNGNRLAVSLPGALDPLLHWPRLSWTGSGREPDLGAERQRAAADVQASLGVDTAMLVGGENPHAPGRSIVAILAAQPKGLAPAVGLLAAPEPQPSPGSDLVLISGGKATNYRVGDSYTVGTLPVWFWPAWFLAGHPLLVALGIGLAGLLIGLPLAALMRRRAEARR